MKRKATLLFFQLLFPFLFIYAQTGVYSSGSNANGIGGAVSFTIGQIDYSSQIGTTGVITYGIQQPFEILTTLGFESENQSTTECLAYPNPTAEFFIIKTNVTHDGNYTYHLYDMLGRLITQGEVTIGETIVTLKDLPSTVYYLKIRSEKNEIKSFKITKK